MHVFKPIFGAFFAASWLGLVGCSSDNSSLTPSSNSSSSSQAGVVAELTFTNLYALADFPIGVAVTTTDNPAQSIFNDTVGPPQQDIITQHFSQITPGNIMKMSYLHNEYNNFTFGDADYLVDWAIANGIGVHAHTFIWHRDYQWPQWVREFSGAAGAELRANNPQLLQERLDHHVTRIATHFAGRVDSWDVVNEVIDQNNGVWGYRNSLFYQVLGYHYIDNAFIAARAADPQADLYYNDYNISPGEGKFQFMLQMIDGMRERNVPIDGVGFQMHVHMGWPSINNIRSSFQAIVNRGLKVKITELDIPLNNPFDGSYNYPNNYRDTFTPTLAQQQKRRYCQIMEAYLDVVPPAQRGGFTVWGVYDGDTWLNDEIFGGNHIDWPLLFDTQFRPKPAAQGVGDALMGHPC